MKVKFIGATTDVDLENERFTPEALEAAARDTKLPLPIMFNFNAEYVVGKVTSLEYEDGKLMGVADLENLAVVLGFEYDPEADVEVGPDGVKVFSGLRIGCFGLTAMPADRECRLTGEAYEVEDGVTKLKRGSRR